MHTLEILRLLSCCGVLFHLNALISPTFIIDQSLVTWSPIVHALMFGVVTAAKFRNESWNSFDIEQNFQLDFFIISTLARVFPAADVSLEPVDRRNDISLSLWIQKESNQ